MRIRGASLWCALMAAGLLLAAGEGAGAQPPRSGYRAWIAIGQEGGVFRVEPTCLAPEDSTLAYRLTARKTGASGVSSSSQSGRVAVAAGQSKVCCRLALNIKPGDRYEFALEVFKDGVKVAEALAASPQNL